MSGRPITLAAALRDAQSGDAVARNLAIRHLAPLILEGLGPAAPRWQAWELHPSGAQARAALRRAWTSDPEPAIRGVAATGLAQLGDPTLLPDLEDRLPGWRAGERGAGEPDLEAARFVRECGLIALSLLGAAAREADEAIARACADHLRAALTAEVPDVRFQAGAGLAALGATGAEEALVEALAAEEDPQVRAGLVAALGELDPPGPRAVAALVPVLSDRDTPLDVAVEAALAVTAAGDPRGGPRLVEALEHAALRDRAIEGLAALGRAAPAEAGHRLRQLVGRWLTPAVTKVRAAYALARVEPDPGRGLGLLARYEKSLSKQTREAVVDARQALATLRARDGAP